LVLSILFLNPSARIENPNSPVFAGRSSDRQFLG